MKLSDIKTEQQFYDFADIWYQRAHNLRRIWQDSNETSWRQAKAHRLWTIMEKRVIKLTGIAFRIQTRNNNDPNRTTVVIDGKLHGIS